ncbi:MAG TPA: ABC transporter permease [Sporolactobacillaceae bacterium]|nr:ABC transporter permease [Sporolactobacillaceae bacterium]
MEKVDQLWQERRGEFWQTASRYIKLLSNSGFMFTMYILILIGGVYYQRWVSGLTDTFPTEWILTIVFLFLVFRTPIRTFLQPADLVFLLPIEKQLTSYFKKSIVYNAVLQNIVIVFVWAIAMPLYLHTVNANIWNDVVFLVLLLALKVWNVYMVWQEHYILESGGYDFLRGTLSFIFIGCILFQMPWWTLVAVIVAIFLVTVFVFNPLSKHLLKWEKVLASEERQIDQFFRLANLITDVPKMQQRMKPRRWLTWLTDVFPYGKTAVYKKFYLKTFIRSGEYLGIWFRLVIIGVIVMAFLPSGITTIVLAVVFTYLTSIQILALWKEYLNGPTNLFHLPFQFIKKSFLNVFMVILGVQIVIYSAAAFFLSGSPAITGLTLLCGFALCFIFTYGYVGMKIKQ